MNMLSIKENSCIKLRTVFHVFTTEYCVYIGLFNIRKKLIVSLKLSISTRVKIGTKFVARCSRSPFWNN